MGTRSILGGALLLLLAVVFSIGLAFASLELPSLLHRAIVDETPVLAGDPLADDAGRVRVELFLDHYHLRTIGYLCFGVMVALIVLGFALGRTGLAAAGAALMFLPVFAQFAAVMFFLAGLGLLNLVWMPVLDLSFDAGHLGDIVYLPYELVGWAFLKLGIDVHAWLVWGMLAGGMLLFILGTWAWLAARSGGRDVADSWVYRVSRHPQYLGWIVWSYGMLLALMHVSYPKRSWGIAASLPWLLSAMVIVGVALLEEARMERRFGAGYERYRARTPFLLPLPRWLADLFTLPSRLMFDKPLPERGGEVAAVLAIFTCALVGLSWLSWRAGETPALPAEVRDAAVGSADRAELYILALRQGDTWHRRRPYVDALRSIGSDAVPHLVELLDDPSPGLREIAAQLLGDSGSPDAVAPLLDHLGDPVASVRFWIISALGELRAAAAVDPLLAVLEAEDSGSSCAGAAVTALGAIGAEEAVDALVARLDEPQPWARANVVSALGNIASSRAVGPLLRLLEEEPQAVEVRRAAMAAFALIRAPETEAALQAALDDPDREVRIYAAEALRSLGR